MAQHNADPVAVSARLVGDEEKVFRWRALGGEMLKVECVGAFGEQPVRCSVQRRVV